MADYRVHLMAAFAFINIATNLSAKATIKCAVEICSVWYVRLVFIKVKFSKTMQ